MTTLQTDPQQPTPDPDGFPAWYYDRDTIEAMARRLVALLPGGNKMGVANAMVLAQYALAIGANPFRGDVYGYVDPRRGNKFVIVEGYKLLVRWAKFQMPYLEQFERMPEEDPELPAAAIGYRCWILRNDSPYFLPLVHNGVGHLEALRFCATMSVGIVTKDDRRGRQGQDIAPPVTWTWDERARTRALKNALRKSHTVPHPQDVWQLSWSVGNTLTSPKDWYTGDPTLSAFERERLAAVTAQSRDGVPVTRENADEVLANGREILHGVDVEEI